MKQRRRTVYTSLRFCMLGVSVIVVAVGSAKTFVRLQAFDGIALAIALALSAVLLRIHVPALSSLYGKRRPLEPGRMTLQLGIVVTIFTIYGPIAAAALQLCAYALAITTEGRSRIMRRLLSGGCDAFFWLCLGVARAALPLQTPQLSGESYLEFLAFFVVGIFASLFLVWMPLRTLEETVSIVRLLRRLVRDTRLFAYALLIVSWGYVCTMVWLHAGPALGLASFAPLPFITAALRTIHTQRLEVHRLRLARDAVQAMLRTNDPLPQINSLLASLHTPAAEETLQIYATLTPEDRHAPLATIGPIPDADRQDAVRRALIHLQHTEHPSVSRRLSGATLTAYAVRTADDELLGALVVHRNARTASFFSARRFAQAASELAPLLRDFRSIAATQTAARVDVLTGLPNRRTIMEMLRERIEHVSIGNPCAVLLLDIDHFKSINDTLGHQAGDSCLRTVGALIARNIRNMDRAGRIGGEEFVVLMPDTTSEMALIAGERLRSSIENADVRHANGEPVTASIGVAVASVSDTVDSLLARADRALYQAKRQGRNRVIELGA